MKIPVQVVTRVMCAAVVRLARKRLARKRLAQDLAAMLPYGWA